MLTSHQLVWYLLYQINVIAKELVWTSCDFKEQNECVHKPDRVTYLD